MNTEQKTPEQWFQQLKEPYRSEAIANICEHHKNELVPTLLDALYRIKKWEETLQGFQYWHEIKESIYKGETTYLETELKPQDMISGEWYKIVCTEFKFLIQFKEIEGDFIAYLKGWNLTDKRFCLAKYVCSFDEIKSIRKATREEVLEHFPDEFKEEKKSATNSIYQPLFNLLDQEHNVCLLDSEMQEILNVCEKILEARKREQK